VIERARDGGAALVASQTVDHTDDRGPPALG